MPVLYLSTCGEILDCKRSELHPASVNLFLLSPTELCFHPMLLEYFFLSVTSLRRSAPDLARPFRLLSGFELQNVAAMSVSSSAEVNGGTHERDVKGTRLSDRAKVIAVAATYEDTGMGGGSQKHQQFLTILRTVTNINFYPPRQQLTLRRPWTLHNRTATFPT